MRRGADGGRGGGGGMGQVRCAREGRQEAVVG